MNRTDFSDEKAKAEARLAQEVEDDFLSRRADRKKLERGWELNMDFVSGRQYCGINSAGEIEEEEKAYGLAAEAGIQPNCSNRGVKVRQACAHPSRSIREGGLRRRGGQGRRGALCGNTLFFEGEFGAGRGALPRDYLVGNVRHCLLQGGVGQRRRRLDWAAQRTISPCMRAALR